MFFLPLSTKMVIAITAILCGAFHLKVLEFAAIANLSLSDIAYFIPSSQSSLYVCMLYAKIG